MGLMQISQKSICPPHMISLTSRITSAAKNETKNVLYLHCFFSYSPDSFPLHMILWFHSIIKTSLPALLWMLKLLRH